MQINSLSLSNYRNYERLDLHLPRGRVLLAGENAQGKTNLLEAIYLLATLRSPRTESDADLVSWATGEDELPAARVTARVERQAGPITIELHLIGRRTEAATGDAPRPVAHATRRIRVNGLPRRAIDAVGLLTAVFFSTADIELITGSPAGRRRYLDLTLSQVDVAYRRHASEYAKVLTQRNALLKRIQEGRAREDEIDFWDSQLVEHGGVLLATRAAALREIGRLAAEEQAALTGDRESLEVRYLPRVGDAAAEDLLDVPSAAAALRGVLLATRTREVQAGMTLSGPHRDDLATMIGGADAASFGSRAQQRTVALAMRLAEARFIEQRTGEEPVLLLDDVLSEMDRQRRSSVMARLGGGSQVLITTAEPEVFGPEFMAGAAVYTVRCGDVTSGAP